MAVTAISAKPATTNAVILGYVKTNSERDRIPCPCNR